MDQIYMDLARGSVSLMDLKAKIQRLESFSNDEVLSWSIQLSMDEIENCLINNKDTLVRLVDENAALKRQIQILQNQLTNGEWLSKTCNLLPELQKRIEDMNKKQ